MKLAPVKRLGACLGCDAFVYEIVQVFPEDHAFFPGHPQRVGAMTDGATQVEFLLSDGSTAAITFCLECAQAITPADYAPIWLRVTERALRSFRAAGRGEAEVRVQTSAVAALWPVAVLRKRREGVEPGVLVVDRR